MYQITSNEFVLRGAKKSHFLENLTFGHRAGISATKFHGNNAIKILDTSEGVLPMVNDDRKRRLSLKEWILEIIHCVNWAATGIHEQSDAAMVHITCVSDDSRNTTDLRIRLRDSWQGDRTFVVRLDRQMSYANPSFGSRYGDNLFVVVGLDGRARFAIEH